MYTPGRINQGGRLNLAQLQRELDLIAKETKNLRNITKAISNSFPPVNFVLNILRSKMIDWDDITPTRDAEDNITQLVYERGGSTIVTETRTYNQYGHINTQVLTGEVAGTWTHSYESDNETWNGVTKS